VLILYFSLTICGLRFMPNTFTDLSEECAREGKIGRFLDMANPALYIRLDQLAIPSYRKMNSNKTINCEIDIQTVRPLDNDKEMTETDALSLIILELNYSRPFDPETDSVQVVTSGYFGRKSTKVVQDANYGTNRIWTNNPTFLLSGQLTGFDPIETRHRTRHLVHESHIYSPDRIFSTFDNPASITVTMRNWAAQSKIYLIFTSYKLVRNGQMCREGAEYECPTDDQFQQKNGRLCMSLSLACDGLPNCGENIIPNADEACFKIHWSSVLLSLVSYILLAITMLLCMSCFARILIQWSVRSSMEEMRCHSVRSSSRFFSLFGGSFSRHWDRPPPTYDESLKHINPDLQQRPPDPPPYSESFRARFPLSRSLLALRNTTSQPSGQTTTSAAVSGTSTPPPLYTSCEDVANRQQESVSLNGSISDEEKHSTVANEEVEDDATDVVFSQPHSRHNSGSGHSSRHASRHNSGHSVQSGARRVRSYRNSEDMGDIASMAPLVAVVRTSQSGIIPDTPGPLPEISGLIPDTAEIDPAFQAWLSGSHNRTTKSGILVENPITRVGVQDEAASNEPDSESAKGNLNVEDASNKD